jgi:predicted dehydrogenase
MTTRWAIVGTGGIAHQMARTLGPMPDAEITAAYGSSSALS